MQEQQTSKHDNVIGLYVDPESGRYIGCVEEVQADAVVRAGYKLVEEGREAAMKPESEYPGAKTEEAEEPAEEAKVPAKKASK